MQVLEVFYDGQCILCSREIAYYRNQKGGNRVQWIDFSAQNFDSSRHGFPVDQLEKSIHSRRGATVFQGVDTFIQIWGEIPKFRSLARISSNRFLRPFLDVGYMIFARIRPYLPKRKGVSQIDCNC